ncbi:MAG: 5'-methylthioadenosine/S-adenosylhomocysteine nucleosidase [Candidatus Scalinduaceae bacterium]
MIAIISALRQEIYPIKVHLNVSKRYKLKDVLFYQADLNGLPVTLVQSGIGRKKAIKAIDLLLQNLKVKLLISSGVAGGIRHGINIGDLIIAENVSYSKNSEFKSEELQVETNFSCNKDFVQLAARLCSDLGLRSHNGNTLTVDNVIDQATTKKKIGDQTSFLAVDMESAAVAEVAHERGIEFVAIRSISDDIEDDLDIDYSNLISDKGKVRFSNLALKVMKEPQQLANLRRLNKQTKTAVKRLSSFMLQYIPSLYDEMLA